jgi:hypothetical protein
MTSKKKEESGKQFQRKVYFEGLSELQIGNYTKIADVTVKYFGAAQIKRYQLKIKVVETNSMQLSYTAGGC